MGRRRTEWSHLATLPLDSLTLPEDIPATPREVMRQLEGAMERQGLLLPILVQELPDGHQYRVLEGVKRLQAARALGWGTIHCLLLNPQLNTEAEVIAAMRHGEADAWQLAGALASTQKQMGWTQTQLGQVVGRTRDYIAGMLVLNRITADTREILHEAVRTGSISARHLRYIGRLPPGRQPAAARRVLERGLSSKDLEREHRHRRPRHPREKIKLRPLKADGGDEGTAGNWRRYYRQLLTDLRRVERAETQAGERYKARLRQAVEERNRIQEEARGKRKALNRELRRVRRMLEGG